MNRREFLKFIASGAAFLFADRFNLPVEAKTNDNYYHIVLISDLHLPWRDKKFAFEEGFKRR